MAKHKKVAKYSLLKSDENSEFDQSLHEAAEFEKYIESKRSLFRQPLFWSTVLLSLIAAFGWLGLFISIRNQNAILKREPAERAPWDDAVPKFPNMLRKFEYNTSFIIGPDIETAWMDLVPPGNGFIELSQGEELGLQKGVEVFGTKAYCVSVSSLDDIDVLILHIYTDQQWKTFHQIHCLSTIRNALAMPMAVDFAEPRGSHIGHCIEFLRQQIMCSADTALEHRRADGGETEVDGWGVTHQCRDWDAIWRWARDNRPKLKEQT